MCASKLSPQDSAYLNHYQESTARAVESIAKQTLRPVEVILADDQSGDDTLSVLQTLRNQYGDEWIAGDGGQADP